MYLQGKKVLIAGMGRSGLAVIDALHLTGAIISLYDQKEKDEVNKNILEKAVRYQLKTYFGEEPHKMDTFDLLVLSPGIPLDIMLVKSAKDAGVEIIGELELAYRLCEGKFIAITGTNGKTTTTALTGEIFKKAGKETYVVGNIGVAAVSKALEALKDTFLITEVSSFQLETIRKFKPVVSAILNITPDHLNRHKTMEKYADTKARIFMNQDKEQFVIVNYDNKEAYELTAKSKAKVIPFSRKVILETGCFIKDGDIIIKDASRKVIHICSVKALKVPGSHNLENALAAVAIAYWAGISADDIRDALKDFEGVEHRIEYVDAVKGVRFVNDSKGTNPDASIKAIEAIQTPMIVIAGGMDKGSDYEAFIQSFNNKVKYMVLLGETAEKIQNTAKQLGFSNITIKEDMDACVREAFEFAQEGDTVLLSPACASWDMYPNFEMRGQHFKDCVKSLRRTLNV